MFHVYIHGIQITTMSPAQHLTTSCQVYTLHISQSLSNEMKDFFFDSCCYNLDLFAAKEIEYFDSNISQTCL